MPARRRPSEPWGPRPVVRGARPVAPGPCRPTPLEAALESLGGRERRVVLWHLFWQPRTFFELLHGHPRVGRRALRRELVALERLGLVRYQVRNRALEGATWALTPLGETLKPLVGAMYLWGLEAARTRQAGHAPSPADAER